MKTKRTMANKTVVDTFANNESTNDGLQELNDLEQQFNYLVSQYGQVQQSIMSGSLDNISRTGTNNPYRNKMVSASGAIGNVTSQGVYKWFDSWDTINATQGKNGCPSSNNITSINQKINDPSQSGQIIPGSPNLLVGTPMKSGQSCGYEGSNVYTSRLIDNPSSTYIGCYNDTDTNQTMVSAVPILTSNSGSSGYKASQSSAYTNNETTYGAWAAFDQNPQTYWHSNTLYNPATGAYQGSANANGVNGEYIKIELPSAVKVLQYSISPRLDVITVRSPNSWYFFGYKSGQWTQLDRQVSQQFVSSTPRTYTISNPDSYTAYLIVVDVVGNSDVNSSKDSVQIAELTLYKNSPNTSLTALSQIDANSGYLSYDKCQQYALDNGYTYFGLQDYQESNGTGLCGVSNDIAKIRGYGSADEQATASPIWGSNTSGSPIKRMELRNDGSIALVDTTDGTVYWSSPAKPADCVRGGYVNPDTVSGSYGGNCIGKPKGVDCKNPSSTQSYSSQGILGNITNLMKNKAQGALNSGNANWSYNPLADWSGGDPAYCCNKQVDYSYQCGSGPFKSGRQSGGAISFNCSQEVANCVFFLILQDDGNMCIYRGQDPSTNKGGIWCTGTNGKQKNPNNQWTASKSKYGRNYIKSGETLSVGEWLGSSDGSLRLVMQQDGNLVLYTSVIKSGCQRDSRSGKNFGTTNVNAVYQLSSVGNKASLGKVGYVDADSNLHEYPSSMLAWSNDYNIIQGYNSGGNDISSQQVNDLDGCKVACNNVADCAGIVYQESTKTCWLKNERMYPKGDKQAAPGLTLGIRKPAIKSSVKGNRTINEVDTVRYDNYVKGPAVDANYVFDSPVVSSTQKAQLDSIESQMQVLGQQIASRMTELYKIDQRIYDKMNMNEQQFKNNLKMYQDITLFLNKEKQSAGIVEGMRNLSDINGQLLDTDLRVLQENYSYIFWSVLALGLLTVTVSTMKK